MEILEYFYKYHKDLLDLLKKCEHNYDDENLNSYHYENDCFTHTMMVYNNCDNKFLQICAMLHDIGKIYCREEKHDTKRVRFFGHEGMSTCLSVGILNDMVNKGIIRDKDKIDILLIINNHSLFNDGTDIKKRVKYDYLPSELLRFIHADHFGRICLDNKKIIEIGESPTTINFSENKRINNLVLMVGLPCSGKSTYIEENYSGYKIISRDCLVEKYGVGDNYNEKFSSLSKEMQKDIDVELMQIFQQATRNKENIIIDMTLLSEKSRRRFLHGIKGYRITANVMLTDFDTVLDRNKNRKGKVLSNKVIFDMAKRLSIPTEYEFNEVNYVFE